MALNKELLDILACPECKGGLELNEKKELLHCSACVRSFPIKEGVPVFV